MGKNEVSRRALLANAAVVTVSKGVSGESGAAAPPRNPVVRVVTLSQEGLPGNSSQAAVDGTMARLEQAGSYRPDIACLPELALRGPAETVPGNATNLLSAWARGHSCYVVLGLKTLVRGEVYNSAVVIDRQGRVMGQYDKLHPTEAELAAGIIPGRTDVSIFPADFGAIGIQICFDVNWWDTWKLLKAKGAKIVFFPSAYPAARQIGMLALMNQCYVVSATQRGPCALYDITGGLLASSGIYQHWAAAALPVGKRLFETDFHVDKVRRIQSKYGAKVELAWFHDDSWFTLASLDPNLTVEDLIEEFGLTPLDEYRNRAGAAIQSARTRHTNE